MLSLGIWPEFERGESFGTRYVRINDILRSLSEALGIDLWTLDAVWWQFSRGSEPPVSGDSLDSDLAASKSATKPHFGLERHLHDFLYDNWSHTDLGREWKTFTQPGEPDAGYEYMCAVGRIDILARHCTLKKWLVVELKRDDSSDSVVGQALRYMGWVRRHLAEPGDEVRGLIIARSGDLSLQYAISTVPGLEFMTYEVEFRLNPMPPLEETKI